MDNIITMAYITVDNLVQSFTFDTVTQVNTSDVSTITSYPTALGTPVSDNIYNNPSTITLAVKVSSAEQKNDFWGENQDRATNAHDTLLDFKANGTLFTVYTPTHTYDNMVISEISNVGSNTDMFNFNGTIKLTEIKRVGESKEEIFVQFTPSDDTEESATSSASNEQQSDSNTTSIWQKIAKALSKIFAR